MLPRNQVWKFYGFKQIQRLLLSPSFAKATAGRPALSSIFNGREGDGAAVLRFLINNNESHFGFRWRLRLGYATADPVGTYGESTASQRLTELIHFG